MKKITAILLMFLMVSSTLCCNAEEVKGTPNTFFGLTYVSSWDHNNIVKPVNLTKKMIDELGVVGVVKSVKSAIKALPEGRRGLDINSISASILSTGRENRFFAGENVTYAKEYMNALFSQLKKEEVPIDFVVDDNEGHFSVYVFENEAIAHFRDSKDDVYTSIAKNGHLYEEYIKQQLITFQNHELYETELRPILEREGFIFSENYDLEYINLFPNAQEPRKTKFYESNPPEGAENCHTIFNNCVNVLFARQYNEAITDVILKYYPDAKITNYGSTIHKGGYDAYTAWGLRYKFSEADSEEWEGTHTSPVIYGKYKAIREMVPPGYPYDIFKATSFNVLLIEKQQLDSNLMGSAPHGTRTMPWIGMKSWSDYIANGDPANGVYHNFRGTDYYQEMVFHVGMNNPEAFQVFDHGGIADDMILLSKLFSQLDEIAGFDDREAIVPQVKNATKIDQRYLLTGMYAGGRNIWRITPDLYTPGVSIENFKVSDSPLTFRIGNQFVEFPDGSYIYEPEEKLSEYGYWVISPKGTRPNEFRDSSLPVPDEPVETDDDIPTGYMLEAKGDGKASDLYENQDNKEEDTKADEENQGEAEVEAVTLKLSPIDYSGKNLALITDSLPADAKGHWGEDTMANLFALGILKGTDMGMLPDSNVKMSELVTMLMRILGVSVETYDNSISGLSEEAWYKNEIFTALKGGWIEADDVAVADTPVTREKSVLIFYNAVKSLLKEGEGVSFADEYRIAQSAREAVAKISAAGLISGYPDGEFKPKNMITRAEAAVIIENFLVYIR